MFLKDGNKHAGTGNRRARAAGHAVKLVKAGTI
jgi:hypothetical protein